MRPFRRYAVLAALAVAGCSDHDGGGGVAAPMARNKFVAPMIAPSAPGAFESIESIEPSGDSDKRGARIAYSHNIAITVAPRMVGAHFNALKRLCLDEAALHCALLDASASLNENGLARPTAHIQARLPHESVGRFTQAATAAVEGERQDDVAVLRSATRMDEISGPIADTAARLEQLEDYRKRLLAIEAGRNARVEDLIKVAEELAKVQSQIEALRGSHRRLEERADTELVSVYIEAAQPAGGSLAPIGEVWREGASILGHSTAAALRFVLNAAPWTVVFASFVAAAVWLLRLLLARLRQKSA